MDKGVPLTPDILTQLKDRATPSPTPRLQQYSNSTQFLLFLVAAAALMLSTFPLLIRHNNAVLGRLNSNSIIPALNPTPTPDSSLLFYLHDTP